MAGVLRQHYPRSVLYFAVLGLLIANTINAGADIGAVAAGINLLLPIPVHLLIVPIGVLLLIVQVLGSYRVLAKIFKWLTLSLSSSTLELRFSLVSTGMTFSDTRLFPHSALIAAS